MLMLMVRRTIMGMGISRGEIGWEGLFFVIAGLGHGFPPDGPGNPSS